MSKKGQLKNNVTLTHDTPAVVPLNLMKRLLFSPCTKAKIPVRTPCQKNFRSIDFFEFYQSKELISKHQYMRLLGRSISTTKLNRSFGDVVLAIVKVLQSNIPAMAGPDRIARHNQLRNVFYHTLVAAGV